MKTVLGCIRRADTDFGLIEHGDRIAVGVSGGKDSLLLLYALALYRKFEGKSFTLEAITLDMGLRPFDVSGIERLCAELDVPYTLVPTQIAEVIFDIRKESSPCSLCAKMRRGALNEAAKTRGCNKIALGHHSDDVIETLMLSLVFESRIHTFHPNTYMSRTGMTAIRPLVYLPERSIINLAKKLELPVVHNVCTANGNTKREEMKTLLAKLTRTYPELREYMAEALRNTKQYGLWDKKIVGVPEEKKHLAGMDAMENLLTRRSCRSFKPEQIGDDQLNAVLKAGAYAPSGRGQQSAFYVVVQDAPTRAQLSRMNAQVNGASDDPYFGAPTIVLAFADLDGATPVPDVVLGLGNMYNAAHALGLGSCYINRTQQMFESDEGKALLAKWGVTRRLKGVGSCILGYPQGDLPAAKPRREDSVIFVR